MKKRLILILGLSAIPLVGGICLFVWMNRPIQPGVTPENFQRLHIGMTEKEVEAILGKHTGMDRNLFYTWEQKGCMVTIFFALEDRAFGGTLESGDGIMIELGERPPALIERIREFAGF